MDLQEVFPGDDLDDNSHVANILRQLLLMTQNASLGNLNDSSAEVGDLIGDPSDSYDYIVYVDGDLGKIFEPWTKDNTFWPVVITYGLTFILGIVGNLLVVFALLVDRKAHNVTSYFLISLAIADLTFLVVCVPYEYLLELRVSWTGGSFLCKLAHFVEMLSTCATVLNLMALSIERYIVIVHPLKSRSWCTIGNTKKILVTVWIVAFLLASPILHSIDTNITLYYNNVTSAVVRDCEQYNIEDHRGRIAFSYYKLAIMFVLPCVVMVFCYSLVIRVLWSSTKALARMTSVEESRSNNKERSSRHSVHVPTSHTSHSTNGHVTAVRTFTPRTCKDHSVEVREARKQVIRMLLAIVAVFFLCWGPKLVLSIMKRHELSFLHHDEAFYVNLVFNLLPYIQSCLNPIIYSFMSNNFRRSMRTACRSYCGWSRCRRVRRQRSLSLETTTKHIMGNSPTITTKSATHKPYVHLVLATGSTNC